MEEMIEFIKNDTAGCVALIMLIVSILSVYLSLIEYYRTKAKNDFFFIEDAFREPMRSSFHPEYLSFSLVILILAVTVYLAFPDFFKLKNFSYITALVIIAAVYVISFFFKFFIFLCFQHAKNKELKAWHKKTYRKNLFVSASLKAAQWFLFALFTCLGEIGHHSLDNICWVILGFVSGALVYLCCDYYVSKKLLTTHSLTFLSFTNNEYLYIILATKNEKHYCLQAKRNKANLTVYVNKVLIVSVDGNRTYERIYSNNILRITSL